MWRILNNSRQTKLSGPELHELKRMCEILDHVSIPIPRFDENCNELCRSIHASGVFEGGRLPNRDQMLAYIDLLRALLKE
jgi:hypothetical protein